MTPRLICFVALLLIAAPVLSQEVVYPVGIANQRPTVTYPNANGYRIVNGFREEGHTGVDLANGAVGGTVRAISAGTVTQVCEGWCYGFGNVVIIRHNLSGGPFYSLYAHMLDGSLLVSAGDTVSAGRKIGEVGNTGRSTGPHLHFAVKTRDQLGCGYIIAGSCNSEWGQEAIYQDPLQFVFDRNAPAQSTLVSYTFTGVVTSLFFSDAAYWAGIGIEVSVGDHFEGRLTYDRSHPYTSYDPTYDFYVYDGALRSFEVTISGNPTFRISSPGIINHEPVPMPGLDFESMQMFGHFLRSGTSLTTGFILNSTGSWIDAYPPLPSALPPLSFFNVWTDRTFRLTVTDSPGPQIRGELTSLTRQ